MPKIVCRQTDNALPLCLSLSPWRWGAAGTGSLLQCTLQCVCVVLLWQWHSPTLLLSG